MKLAIMQPYLFPYLGYFQLISAADKFVVYDDVSFIKQGWINRNRILAHGKPLVFTVPLTGAGSFVPIHQVKIHPSQYAVWRNKFLKTLDQYYRQASQYKKILPVIEEVLIASPEFISDVAVASLKATCTLLGITTEIVGTSQIYQNSHLKSQERVIDICRKEQAEAYVNAIGGMELYSRSKFQEAGTRLSFLKSKEVIYKQFDEPFVPWLSVIDVLMFNEVETVRELLGCYVLV